MRQITLSGLVKRRFIHYIRAHELPARDIVEMIGIPPGDLCRIIAGQNLSRLPLEAYYQLAIWLHMPLANVTVLADITPRLQDLIQLGMKARGYCPTSARDQVIAADDAGVSVAVFRRALHGYPDFRPSIWTCNRFANWLVWTGCVLEDIARAADMIVCYLPDGQPITIAVDEEREITLYPCACGRAGCMVPAYIPNGPRRKWRSDACRMWAKRKAEREMRAASAAERAPVSPLPNPAPIVRFIMINERRVPLRF